MTEPSSAILHRLRQQETCRKRKTRELVPRVRLDLEKKSSRLHSSSRGAARSDKSPRPYCEQMSRDLGKWVEGMSRGEVRKSGVY